jgi:hypothetical protein
MLPLFPFPPATNRPDIRAQFRSLLFLDIDGVLHPCRADTVLMCHLPLLADWLRKNSNVGVVCASSWRSEGPNFLAAELHLIADFLLGWTVTDEENISVSAGEFAPERGARAGLCRFWMEQHEWVGVPAAALDDMHDLYPEEFGIPLVAVNSDVGITTADLDRLGILLA